jgi:hypothetical protein
MKIRIAAIRLLIPAIGTGLQLTSFIRNPAVLHRIDAKMTPEIPSTLFLSGFITASYTPFNYF